MGGYYIAQEQCKYEVPNDMLDEAVKWLEGHPGWQGGVRHAAYRENTSIIYPDEDGFGGYVRGAWSQSVNKFMKRFCLPRSYATFREDDEFQYSMVVKKDDGTVEWDSEDFANPFLARCEELEDEPLHDPINGLIVYVDTESSVYEPLSGKSLVRYAASLADTRGQQNHYAVEADTAAMIHDMLTARVA